MIQYQAKRKFKMDGQLIDEWFFFFHNRMRADYESKDSISKWNDEEETQFRLQLGEIV